MEDRAREPCSCSPGTATKKLESARTAVVCSPSINRHGQFGDIELAPALHAPVTDVEVISVSAFEPMPPGVTVDYRIIDFPDGNFWNVENKFPTRRRIERFDHDHGKRAHLVDSNFPGYYDPLVAAPPRGTGSLGS